MSVIYLGANTINSWISNFRTLSLKKVNVLFGQNKLNIPQISWCDTLQIEAGFLFWSKIRPKSNTVVPDAQGLCMPTIMCL